MWPEGIVALFADDLRTLVATRKGKYHEVQR